jgi:HD domain
MATTFPSLPISGVTLPDTPLTRSALSYSKQHTSPATVSHCLRSSAFALLIARKLSLPVTPEVLVLSTLLHDLGWATTRSLLSKDKRFEVDGANLAKAFLSESSEGKALDLNQIWTAIAMHTTVSITLEHPDPNIAATCFGIGADFAGPNLPGGLIGVEEYKEIVGAFPRLGFASELVSVLVRSDEEEDDRLTFKTEKGHV